MSSHTPDPTPDHTGAHTAQPGDTAPANGTPADAKKAVTIGATGRTAIFGAMFLMATSSIGPGFITQTSVFTVQLGVAFAFAILVSLLVDIAIQLNVWRVLGVTGLRPTNWATGCCRVSAG